jgi:hypothetical protein
LNVTEAYIRQNLPIEVSREVLKKDVPAVKPDHRSPEVAAANRAAVESLMGS